MGHSKGLTSSTDMGFLFSLLFWLLVFWVLLHMVYGTWGGAGVVGLLGLIVWSAWGHYYRSKRK